MRFPRSTNVAILTQLFQQAIIALNKLIGNQHYKRLRRRIIIAFHLPSQPRSKIHHSKILQSDPDTGINFSKSLLISFKRDQNKGNFLVGTSFQTSDQPGTFKCVRARCKACAFICNVEKMSGPKRSIKITDHFTCTSANVICCITCTLCKKLYISQTETTRRPIPRTPSRGRERRQTETHLNRSLDTFICPIILSNIWQSAASPYIKDARRAAKL